MSILEVLIIKLIISIGGEFYPSNTNNSISSVMNLHIFTFYYRNYFLLNKQFSVVSTDEKTAKATLLKIQKIADYILDMDSELIGTKVQEIKEGIII